MNTLVQIMMVVVLLANSLLPIPGLLQQAETPTPTPTVEVTETPVPSETPTTEFTETPSEPPTETPTEGPVLIEETPVFTETPAVSPTPTASPTDPGETSPVTLTLSHSSRFIAKDGLVKIKWRLESKAKDKLTIESNYRLSVQLPTGFTPDEFSILGRDSLNDAVLYSVEKEHGVIELFAPADQPGPFEIQVDVMTTDQVLVSETILLERAEKFEASAKGNEISALEGKVKIKIPPGALKKDAQVWVHPVSEMTNVPSRLSENTVELIAENPEGTEEFHVFDQPLEISIAYDPEQYQGNESMVTLFYYDELNQTWRPVVSQVDTENHVVTGFTNHFSLYDISAQDWQAAQLPSLDGFQVSSFTGAGTYTYPIEVPAGPGGLQPNLSLSYNSQTVDRASSRTQASPVGMGWSFDQGYIQRDMHGSNDYFPDDTFNLTVNGVSSRLLPIGGDPDGNPNTDDYRLSDENFWRVRRYRATGVTGTNGWPEDQSYWVVWDKVGNQYTFGQRGYSNCTSYECDGDRAHYPTPSTNSSGGYSIFLETWRWALTRITNVHGQNLEFYYRTDRIVKTLRSGYGAFVDHDIVPTSIVYPNGRYRVRFEWTGRTDFISDWEINDASFSLFSQKKLSQIHIEYLPPETTTNWSLIRKYVFTYANADDWPNQVFPHVSWPIAYRSDGQTIDKPEGRTLTLKSIQEFSSDGGSLPKTTFTYGDYMHLTEVNNGYGGRIVFSYDPWHDSDTFDYKNPVMNDTGWFQEQEVTATWFAGGEFNFLKKSYTPGQYFKVKLHVMSSTGTVCLKYHTNLEQHCFTQALNQYLDLTDTTFLLPATAGIFDLSISCPKPPGTNSGCRGDNVFVGTLPTFYRVTQKKVYDSPTSAGVVFSYSYQGAAMNTTANSAVLAAQPTCTDTNKYNDACYEKPYSEFRGHSQVTETGPDGRVTITTYYQDDILKGKPIKVQVMQGQSVYSETETFYTSVELPAISVFADLKSRWIYTSSTIAKNFEGGSTGLGSKTEYIYDLNLGGQYGNLTNQVEYVWNGQNWSGVRYSRSQYIPLSNGFNLVGLPSNESWLKCNNGICDLANSPSDLLSKTVYLYDDESTAGTPNPGTLIAKRVLLNKDANAWTNQKFSDEKYTYDAWGNRTSVIVYTGEGTNDTATEAAVFNGTPITTTFTYDTTYRTYLLSQTSPATPNSPTGLTSTFTYNYKFGVPLSETGPNGPATTATAQYDNFGRITQIVLPGNNTDVPTMEFIYHDTIPFWTEARQLVTPGSNKPNSMYFSVRKFYDGLGRLVQTQNIVSDSSGAPIETIVSDQAYDAYGRVVRQSIPYSIAPISGKATPDLNQAATQTQYDLLGRPVAITAPNGIVTTSDYDIVSVPSLGWVYATTVTDAKGAVTTQYKDAQGNLVRVVPAEGPGVEYVYDDSNRLSSAIYGGNSTTLTYDLAGRKLTMDDPDMGLWTYQYDARGNLVRQEDEKHQVVCLYYDSLARVMGKQYLNDPADHAINNSCPSSPSFAVTYTYDETTSSFGKGQRTSMFDASGVTTWQYDACGQLIQEERNIEDVIYNTQWTYNSAGLPVTMTYPGNGTPREIVTTTYDSRMQPVSMVSNLNGALVTSAAYDAQSRLTQQTYGNALATNFNYHPYVYGNPADSKEGQLQSIQVGGLLDLGYEQYDPVGNITQINDVLSATDTQVSEYTYDLLGRLTTATASDTSVYPGYFHDYGYDLVTGNLSERTLDGVTEEYTYDPSHPHAATELGLNTYEYDDVGNMTSRTEDGITYTQSWDKENRLHIVTWTDENGQEHTTTFVYDGDGAKVMKVERGPGACLDNVCEITTVMIGGYYEKQIDTKTDDLTYKYASVTSNVQDPEAKLKALASLLPVEEPVESPAPLTAYPPGNYGPDNSAFTHTGSSPGDWQVTYDGLNGRAVGRIKTANGSYILQFQGQGVTIDYNMCWGAPCGSDLMIYIDGVLLAQISQYGYGCGPIDAQNCYKGWTSATYPSGPHTLQMKVNGTTQANFMNVRVWGDVTSPTNPTSATDLNGAPNNVWQGTKSDPNFTWTGAADNSDGTGLAGYYVYWGPQADGISQEYRTSAAYDPSPVSPGTRYLRVQTKDNAGNLAAWKTLFTYKYDNSVPTVPTSIVETHNVTSGVWQNITSDPYFTWTASQDSGGSGLGGYEIYWGRYPAQMSGEIVNVTTAAYDGVVIYNTQNCSYFPIDYVRYRPPFPNHDRSLWGEYYLRIRAKDNAGNTSEWIDAFSLKYDGCLPREIGEAIELHGVQSNFSQSIVFDPTFEWTVYADQPQTSNSGLARYDLYWGIDPSETTVTNTTITPSFDPPQLSSAGTYYLRAKAVDNAGNETAWKTLFTFIYTGVPPQLTIESIDALPGSSNIHINGTTAYYTSTGTPSSGSIEVAARTGASGGMLSVGLDSLSFPDLGGGVTVIPLNGTVQPDMYSQVYALPLANHGEQTVTLTDLSANTSSDTFTVILDDDPPMVTATTIQADAGSGGMYGDADSLYFAPLIPQCPDCAAPASGTFTVSVQAEDMGSGIQDVTFPALFGMSQVVVDNTAPYEHTYTVDPAWAGVGSYAIVVRDHLGHTTEIPVNIVSDFTPPTIGAVNLPDNPSLQFDVAWDAADGDSGVQSYEVQYTCTGCMQPGTLPVVNAPKHSVSFTGQDGISYTFSVRARDRVGNVSQWVSADPVTVQTETKYYLFGGRRVAMRQGSAVYYFHTNHLGSVVLTTDAAGAAVSQTRYLPFGEEHWSSGGSLSDFMYTGQRNTDFGLMDYNARFYSSRLGRFASADTIVPGAGHPLAWDRFAGMGNNPINRVDPTGHADISTGGGCDGNPEACKYKYLESRARLIMRKLGGKNDLEAMALIIDYSAATYKDYDQMIPALSEIFLGLRESRPTTVVHAANYRGDYVDACGGVGCDHGDCWAYEGEGNHFKDTGFHEDFQDEHNQLFHYWAYVATTASTDWNIPLDFIVGEYVSIAANIDHEIFTYDDQATWADFALAQAGVATGFAIGTNLIPPNQLGNFVRGGLGEYGPGSYGMVPRLVARFPLYGDDR